MNATERAFDTVKAIFLYREQIAELRGDMGDLGTSTRALATSHANLRDRVSRIEGYLGRIGPDNDVPRLEE